MCQDSIPTGNKNTIGIISRFIPHPFAYLKSLANAMTEDKSGDFVVLASCSSLCAAVIKLAWQGDKASTALGISVGGLVTLAGYAFHRDKSNQEINAGRNQ